LELTSTPADTDLVDVLGAGGGVQRRTSELVSDADVRVAVDQRPHGRQLAVVGGQMQRRLALAVLPVHERADRLRSTPGGRYELLDDQVDDFGRGVVGALVRDVVQGRATVFVDRAALSAALKQHLPPQTYTYRPGRPGGLLLPGTPNDKARATANIGQRDKSH